MTQMSRLSRPAVTHWLIDPVLTWLTQAIWFEFKSIMVIDNYTKMVYLNRKNHANNYNVLV